MRLAGFRVAICRACQKRPAYRSELCRHCLRLFHSREMNNLDWFFELWFGQHMRENDGSSP